MNLPMTILTLAVLITGIAWGVDKLVWLPRRQRCAEQAIAQYNAQQHPSAGTASESIMEAHTRLRQQALRQPLWLEYSAGFFPTLLFIFLLFSFIVQPFRIPSSSMYPTLIKGDFILVNKFDYGLRLPVINKKIIANRAPRRGEVIVFLYPKDKSMHYIKRVIGLPGDTVSYLNKHLTINDQPITKTPLPDYFDKTHQVYLKQYRETANSSKKSYRVLNNPAAPPFVINAENFPFQDKCIYQQEGVVCTVPEGHYFVMGDNRDGSADSRYWGFVPEENLVGRAFFVWLNFKHLKRIGRLQ
jgi:signal peptidase I